MGNFSLKITDGDNKEIFGRYCQKNNEQRMKDLLQYRNPSQSKKIGAGYKQQG
jgi:hypothetical protein